MRLPYSSNEYCTLETTPRHLDEIGVAPSVYWAVRNTMPRNEDDARWKENPIFAALPPRERFRLSESYPAEILAPQRRIIDPDASEQTVVVLHRGAAQVRCESFGDRSITIALCKAPMIFGELEALLAIPSALGVDSLTECSVSRLPASMYRELLEDNASMRSEALQHLAAWSLHGTRRLAHGRASLEAQVASFLLSYQSCVGPASGASSLPITYNELAASLGVVGRSIAQVFMRLQREDVVAVRPGEIRIRDRAGLESRSLGVSLLCYHIGQSTPRIQRHRTHAHFEVRVLTGPEALVGRSFVVGNHAIAGAASGCQLQLAATGVDARHARLFRAATGGRCWVEDLASHAGVSINGKKRRRAVLRDGDEIQLGSIVLRATIAAS